MQAQTTREKPPENILRKLEELKKNFGNKVVLKRINGKYYLYKQTVKWIKEKKKPKTNSEYLGRIYEDGAFVQKAVTHGDELTNAASIITANGGKVIWPPQAEEPKIPQEAGLAPSELDRRILTELSMDARVSLASLAAKLNMKRSALYYRVKKLEERYGIKYILEIDTKKLGYLDYLMLIKFEENVPEIGKIKEVLEPEPKVQFAAMTSGNFDMIVGFIVDSNRDAAGMVYRLRASTALGGFISKWYVTPFNITYGIMPLRNAAFNLLLEDKVWKRSRDHPTPSPGNITTREYGILKEMNENAVVDFTELDAKNNLDKGASQYTYYRLKEKGIIKRATITMAKPNTKYDAVTIIEVNSGKKFAASRSKVLQEIIRPSSGPTNTHVLVGDIEVPNGAIFITPIFDKKSLNTAELKMNEINGIESHTSVIREVTFGTLCYRAYDNSTTYQAEYLRAKPQQ